MLDEYARKRRFERTPEPGPEAEAGRGESLRFVIQKHAARRLHYDLRLELDGVLKSWAVPKGPSLDPSDKRLAVLVEDHPIDYAAFEGVIPKGEYGAGEMIVWDTGTYLPDEGPAPRDKAEAEARVRQSIEAGKLSIRLDGQKLRGSFALVRMKRSPKEWLLIKQDDAFTDTSRDVLLDDQSVISEATIERLRSHGATAAPLEPEAVPLEGIAGARPSSLPATMAPMLPSLAEAPFSHPQWLFEPKLDGIRVIAIVGNGRVALLTRGGRDVATGYPALVEDLRRHADRQFVLDGEVVAFDETGRPSFERLQDRLHLIQPIDIKHADLTNPVVYFVFDLLHLDGYDLCDVPLVQRKDLLARVLTPTSHVQLVETFGDDGESAYQAVVGYGLEGIMAKRRDSRYEPGRRSHSWLKIKGTQSDDFVIGGYTEGTGGRAATFGSLILGTYNAEASLSCVGHVGTGFDDRLLESLRKRLDGLATDACPFADRPEVNAQAHWVRPELVAEVKYSLRTEDGRLREPVFMRLREDKAPQEATGSGAVPAPPNTGTASIGPGSAPRQAPTPTVTVAEGKGERASRATAPSDNPLPAGPVSQILAQLDKPAEACTIHVQGVDIGLTNLEKVLWPAFGDHRAVTKRDLLRYLARIAPFALPHLRNRPITLVRCPDGLTGQRFFQKHIELGLPPFVETVRLFTEHASGDGDYLLCNNLPTLLWFGQIAGLEMHTWYSRTDPDSDATRLTQTFAGSEQAIEASVLNYPDFVVFDLDPYIYSGREGKGDEPELNRLAFQRTCEVGRWLKELLDSLSLAPFVKTSGRTGLHIFVPVLRQLDYDAIRATCETIGQHLMATHPAEVTMEWSVSKRTGKVFLDHKQNVRGKTLASIFSPRLAAEATVSVPLTWEQLDQVYPTDFTILTAAEIVQENGDPWARILDAKSDLRALLGS